MYISLDAFKVWVHLHTACNQLSTNKGVIEASLTITNFPPKLESLQHMCVSSINILSKCSILLVKGPMQWEIFNLKICGQFVATLTLFDGLFWAVSLLMRKCIFMTTSAIDHGLRIHVY